MIDLPIIYWRLRTLAFTALALAGFWRYRMHPTESRRGLDSDENMPSWTEPGRRARSPRRAGPLGRLLGEVTPVTVSQSEKGKPY